MLRADETELPKTRVAFAAPAADSAAKAPKFNAQSVELISDGMYIVRSKLGKVLDVDCGYRFNGVNVQMWKSNGSNAQKFNISFVGGGYYKILASRSGKAVDVVHSSKKNGANVRQYSWNKSAAQLWKASISDRGGIVFTNKSSGKVLDIAGGSKANGANVQQYKANGSKAQTWTLEATSWVNEFSGVQLEMYNRAQKISSKTKYLIMVDRWNCRIGVFRGSGAAGEWDFIKYTLCTPGKWLTKTPWGTYETLYRKSHLDGEPRAIYCTNFAPQYYFHSVLDSASELGQRLSHGCVRLLWSDAKWIYTSIPLGTRVNIYN